MTASKKPQAEPRGYRPDELHIDTTDDLNRVIGVLRDVHNSISLPEYTDLEGAEKRAARNLLSKKVKPREQNALLEYAMRDGLLLDSKKFTASWKADGKRGETENEAYYDQDLDGWFKRNDLSYHTSYLEFFQRVALHNHLFPEAALQFKGFVVDINRNSGKREMMLKPVLFQKHVEADRGATRQEVRSLMAHIGFRPLSGDDYINDDSGVRVEDLHDENVFVKNGELHVIDPVIFLDDSGKKARLSGNITSKLVAVLA